MGNMKKLPNNGTEAADISSVRKSMQRRATYALAIASWVAASSCYATKAQSPGLVQGGEVSRHQWFALWGAVPLSSDVGSECTAGLASVESKVGVVDMLIDIGVAVGGAILAANTLCQDATYQSGINPSCTLAAGSLATSVLSSRTVSYHCSLGQQPVGWPTAPTVMGPGPNFPNSQPFRDPRFAPTPAAIVPVQVPIATPSPVTPTQALPALVVPPNQGTAAPG